jgi:hypothetical protein
VKATYVDQEGKFLDVTNDITPGSDQFWVVDASLTYRLPKRYGIIKIAVKNAFDQDFQFQDTDPANPQITPDRLVTATITLAF